MCGKLFFAEAAEHFPEAEDEKVCIPFGFFKIYDAACGRNHWSIKLLNVDGRCWSI